MQQMSFSVSAVEKNNSCRTMVPTYKTKSASENRNCTLVFHFLRDRQPYTAWDYSVQLQISTFTNLIISSHSLTTAFIPRQSHYNFMRSCRFPGTTGIFPLPSSICMPVSRAGSRFVEETEKEDRVGLCTYRIAPKFVCAAARLPLSSLHYF